MANYFTNETDKSIKKFLESDNMDEKQKIFQTNIRPAFEKLIESLIYVYRFYNIDDVETMKRDCLASLYEVIPKYDPNRGTKGFSYFNMVAKNWFIQKTRERNKRTKVEAELYYDLDHEVARSDPNFTTTPYEDKIEEKEFWLQFYEEMGFWREKLTKKTEKQVLEAVIFLMKNSDIVTIYNKKAVYLYLRELTGLNTKQVVINLKKIKLLYLQWKDSYLTNGASNDV